MIVSKSLLCETIGKKIIGRMKKKLSKREIEIIKLFGDNIDSLGDVVGEKGISPFFYLWMKKKAILLTGTSEEVLTKSAIKTRRALKPIINVLGKMFLSSKQIMVCETNKIPSTSVIYVVNHFSKDDVASTLLGAKRNAWILFGSIPQFYNSFDGISAWLNGVILINRNCKKSKKRAEKLCGDALRAGVDIIIYPEGVWNKSPNKLLLDLWPGFYRIAKETGCPIVPIVHYKSEVYKKNKKDYIYTVVDDPIYVDKYEQEEAVQMVRNRMATLYWGMMEQYGKSTRAEEMREFNSSRDKWDKAIAQLMSVVKNYDFETETKADYRKKEISEWSQAWKDIANATNVGLKNAHIIAQAHLKYLEMRIDDYQRRY